MKKIAKKIIALSLMFLHIADFSLFRVYALTGGPSQPEVQSFTPVGSSDYVNLFTGDFSYNIPLLDVEGYPINIGYQSGVSMDQEASWVGLGWNINPGAVNRNMRGVPDDFAGDTITKELNMRPNNTYGLETGITAEQFGFQFLSVGYSLGVNYNNYNGISMDQGLSGNLSFKASKGAKSKGTFNLGLNMNSSSSNGLSITPNASYSNEISKQDYVDNNSSSLSNSFTIAAPFNSRAGLRQLSLNYSLTTKNRSETNTKKSWLNSSESLVSATAAFDFGTPTYTPSVDLPMHNYSGTARFTGGIAIYGFHGSGHIQGFFSTQRLAVNKIESPSYGYMNSSDGQKNNNAILDFNREKDGVYLPVANASLPLTNFTFDTYSILAQGISMSYRPMRNDIGFVYDPASYTTSDGGSIGVEVGSGGIVHGGGDFKVDVVNSNSGAWRNGNDVISFLDFQDETGNDAYEPVYFKEAGERSVEQNSNWINSYGGYNPVYIGLEKNSKFNTRAVPMLYGKNSQAALPKKNTKDHRAIRNQVMSYLKNNELDKFGLIGEVNPGHKGHHIGEISVLQPTGERYIFAIPAYNNIQKEVTFAVGQKRTGGNGLVGNCLTGLVAYNHNTQTGDNSIKNERGIDHYFNAVTTPEFTHSHLLTAVVSSDYSDIDEIRGPSDNDLGSYTRFLYQKKAADFKWRVPFSDANFNEGLKSDVQDDKANYIYGEKELWYLDTVVTKNYIAIFHKSDRKDGYGANENGTIDLSKAQLKLDSISLYSKADYKANQSNAIPLKRVHFEYSYELCPNVPNNSGVAESFDLNRDGSAENINAAKGKLTLKRIYFTYQNVQRTRFSPYEFTYAPFNPSYDIKAYDRWGNYMPNPSNVTCSPLSPASNPEKPYTSQNKTLVDQWATSWSLTEILLPSGGKMKVEYESDDYAYVQHKKAMQMFELVAVTNALNAIPAIYNNPTRLPLSDQTSKNYYLVFKKMNATDNIQTYFKGIDQLYFKFLMNFQKTEDPNLPGWIITNDTQYDYVQGYGEILEKGNLPNDPNYGYVKLKPVDLGDAATGDYNPITKAAIQFGRMHLSKIMYDQDVTDMGFGREMLQAMQNSSFSKNLVETAKGPNKSKWDEGRGRKFITNKSYIRLNNPNSKKLGGGLRVKKITVQDAWSEMTQGQHRSAEYGQEYSYDLEDGTSSGVASYEPMLGGEENPFHQPVFYKQEALLAPDNQFYKEEPFGESFFPAPNVGYSRVTVKNIDRANVKRHATGKTIEEFYTAKDFPVITERTDVKSMPDKSSIVGLSSLFKINFRDYITTSQGYYIELNDMHGKPKSKKVYQEDKYDQPISSVDYKYQQQSGAYPNTFRLNNAAQVIDESGNVSTKELGVVFDLVADMRESKTEMTSAGVRVNLDGFYIPPFFTIFVPMALPSYSSEKTQFRSAVTTKVVQRFGILEEVVAYDLGSTVSTKNLAYDEQSGDILLTQVINGFNDPIYSLKYPAHWFYKTMGHAYKNILLEKKSVDFDNGIAMIDMADQNFAEGDELALSDGDKAWIIKVTPSSIHAVTKSGNNVHGFLDLKVIRSGRKNLVSSPMASIASKSNPLLSIKTNIYTDILSASAIEYSQEWKTYCDCISDQYVSNHANPYVIGAKGNWKVKNSQTYLTDRVQSRYNNNTDIRKDGVFEGYSPYYKLMSDNQWKKDTRNWTFTSEVTEFNALGQELENRDALGRYSSSTYGYNGSISLAVAANSRHKELGFDNFEDYSYNPCLDGHFKFTNHTSNITDESAHSGKKSIKVSSGTPVIMSKDIQACDVTACQLDLQGSSANVSPYTYKVSVSGGQAPYTFDYIIYSGSPSTGPIDAQNFGLSGTGYKVKFIVTDANGCSIIKIIEQNASGSRIY